MKRMPFPDLAGPGNVLSWALLLALPLTAGLAYAWGAARTRETLQRELRQAREAQRCSEQLQTGCQWQTDAAHRLVQWTGPGPLQAAQSAIFEDPALAGQLKSGQALPGLRVQAAQLIGGSQHWEVQAVPRWSDSGVFDGYSGAARPLDEEDALRLAAGLSAAALAALPGPAWGLRSTEGGWVLHQANEAARVLWPAGLQGRLMTEARGAVPAGVLDALLGGAPGSKTAQQDIDGWRLAPGSTGQSLLLAKMSGPQAQTGSEWPEHAEADAFSFTLSHDLRAPIRVVEGFTRIVKEDYGRVLDRVGNDHLERVLGAAARMNLMIDALLTLAQLSQQPLARQRVNLSQLASFVVEDLKRSAPERAAEFDIAPGLVATGDPTLLRLVLENLLGNAFKYSAKVAQARISLQSGTQAGKPAFWVHDNGAGFDMRSADRLFGLFQRLHSASDFAGHGVGLASVRRIVQRHGGQIWAESEPGRGATFYFTLPD